MINKLKVLKNYFLYFKNPISVLLFKFGFKKDIVVKIKKYNKELKLNNVEYLNKLILTLPVVSDDKFDELLDYFINIEKYEVFNIQNINFINVNHPEFKNNNPMEYNIHLEEFFTDDDWGMIDFDGRFVIDIGGNCADTALIFAKNNAEVISFEPVKHLYELGRKNISLNPNLKNKINFINKAVGNKRGELNVSLNSLKEYVTENDSYNIEMITVCDVIDEYNFPTDILKIDCEGCEFEVIMEQDLSSFNDIIFEHHSYLVKKSVDILIDKLKKDNFKIDTYPTNISGRSFNEIGIVHAYK